MLAAPVRTVVRSLALFLGLAGLLSGASAETVATWQPVVFPLVARYGAGMAYDSARHRTVLFGGLGNTGNLSDTWEWDGTTWTPVAVVNPSQRTRAAMAYDSARKKVVLFGGYNTGFDYKGDTWEWDGVTWTQVASSGPSPRNGAAMAYDSERDRIVLFGGYSRSSPTESMTYGDTWEWDGVRWTEVATAGPSPSAVAAMAYDAAHRKVILFGGGLGETWAWDGTEWTQVATTGPSPRSVPALAYDSTRQRTVLFGGHDAKGDLGDTWEWDGDAWTQRPTAGMTPLPRAAPSMAYDSARGKVVLFGGTTGQIYYSDTWEWDGNAWNPVAAENPTARSGAPMVYDSARKTAVLFGGDSTYDYFLHRYSGETWIWDGTHWQQTVVLGPEPRSDAAMAYDSTRQKAVLFGGFRYSTGPPTWTYLGDTWEWDGAAWMRMAGTGPSPRSKAALAYDSVRKKTVLFGGSRDTSQTSESYGDTWEWDGATWTQVASTGPAPRRDATMAYDSARGKAVLFGGTSYSAGTGTTYYGDTWEWDGTNWTQVATTGPGPRYGAAMVYDTDRGKVVLFSGSAQSDTWEWDGKAWQQIGASGPSARIYASAAYDSDRQEVILFGGLGAKSSIPFDDTWLMTVRTLVTVADAARALRVAGGLEAGGMPEVPVAGAVALARKAAGLDANP